MYGASVSEEFYWPFALFNTAPQRNIRVAGNCFFCLLPSKVARVAEICFTTGHHVCMISLPRPQTAQPSCKTIKRRIPTHAGRHVQHTHTGSSARYSLVLVRADDPEFSSHTHTHTHGTNVKQQRKIIRSPRRRGF